MQEPARDGRLPDFLIGGEAKCGSTTLWQMLSRHPRVFFPDEKELHFFSSYSDSPGFGRFQHDGIEPYRRLFASAQPAQLCGEATPNYLFDDGACERIGRALPGARLVFILRDPVERAWSHYWHQVRRGRERLGFEAALAAEPGRLASGDENERSRFSYAARGRYVEGLRRYEGSFARDALCVVCLEDLRRDARAVLQAVCAHLALELPGDAGDEPLAHANKAQFPRWPRLDAVTRSLRRWADRRDPRLSRAARRFARLTRPLRVYSGAPRMDESTRRALADSFAASDAELERWLGRPPPWRIARAHPPRAD